VEAGRQNVTTTLRLPIVVSALAEEQIRAAADWWHAHRSKAPEGFREDFERAMSLSSGNPTLALARET
jgi:hypothetical protein